MKNMTLQKFKLKEYEKEGHFVQQNQNKNGYSKNKYKDKDYKVYR